MATSPRLRRGLAVAGGGLALATAATVAIHLGPVREALGWQPLGSSVGGTNSGWCPFGFGGGDRVAHAAPDLSLPRAHARPALGFALGATTRAEVTAWAAAHQIACAPIQHGATLECTDVPAAILPAGEDRLGLASAWFTFGAGDTLAVVKTVRRGPDARTAVAALDAEQAVIAARAGAPAVRDGAKDASELALGALRQAHVDFQFQDYRATVRATNMGDKGYLLTELYAAVL